MKEKKIAFTCGWGQSSQVLYDKYKLIAPERSGQWKYLLGVPNIDEADVVFMFDGMSDIYNFELIEKLKTKKLFVVRTEPPQVHPYPIIIPPALSGRVTVVDFTTQPIWSFGKWWELSKFYSYEDLLNMPYEKKSGKISCLLSNKVSTDGHRSRLRFVNKFVETNQNILTLYGRNNIPTNNGVLSHEEKYSAFSGFEYTLCFENGSIPNYMTEALAEPILMWSMPIYFGATNVAEYLPPDSFHALSKDLGEEDLEMVKDICSRSPSKKNIKAMEEARYLILKKYSLWSSLQYVLENY